MRMKKNVILFLAPGFEEAEVVIVTDILRRANIKLDLVSISNEKSVIGSHNIKIEADKLLNQINDQDYQMLILPGGLLGVNNLKKSIKLKEIVLKFNEEQKYLAAICAAPEILYQWKILKGKNITVYPGVLPSNAEYNIIADSAVVKDGNIITGASFGSAVKFALELIEILVNKDTKEKISKQLVIW